MTVQPTPSYPSRFGAADLAKLKRFLLDSHSRGLESEVVPPQQRGDCTKLHLKSVYDPARVNLPEDLQRVIFRDVLNDMMGYGPIQPLLEDPDISEVMVNGPKKVYVEKKGKLMRSEVAFDDEAHVMSVIERIILPLGRHVDSDSPTVDARLPDGSRVNAVVRPVSLDGPSITVRKFLKDKLTTEQLVAYGTVTTSMA